MIVVGRARRSSGAGIAGDDQILEGERSGELAPGAARRAQLQAVLHHHVAEGDTHRVPVHAGSARRAGRGGDGHVEPRGEAREREAVQRSRRGAREERAGRRHGKESATPLVECLRRSGRDRAVEGAHHPRSAESFGADAEAARLADGEGSAAEVGGECGVHGPTLPCR
ncbi:hypothetical protein LLS1_24160 [Leifsonia sp. LS1]|nr:hypothetical protein LLS1_24160 [Leifsonia sp. LS1]